MSSNSHTNSAATKAATTTFSSSNTMSVSPSDEPTFRRVSLRRSWQKNSIIEHCQNATRKDRTKPMPSALPAATVSSNTDYGWWEDDENGSNIVSTTVASAAGNEQQQQQHPDDLIALQKFLLQCDSKSNRGGADLLPHAPNAVSARVSRTLPGVPVSVIAQRLCHFLRVHSIEHVFQWEPYSQPSADEEEEEGSATTTTTATAASSFVRWYCRTEHMLRFCIFLWRTETDHGNSNAVVVEVQRRAGCSLELHCVRRALFAALADQDSWSMASTNNTAGTSSSSSPSSQQQRMLSPRRHMIPSSLCHRVFQKCRRDDPTIDTASCTSSSRTTSSASSTTNCQQRCQHLLESPCHQSKELALEGLLCLTETAQGEPKQSAEQSILTDVSIQHQLVQILTEDAMNEEEEEDDITATDLRTLVLQLLIASLRRVRDTELEAVMDPAPEFWQSVLRTCLSCLSDCSRSNYSCCSRDVELSIEILQHVLEVTPRARVVTQVVVPRIEELQSDLTKAHWLGQAHLLTLEQKSQDFMDQLQIMYHY